MRYAVFALLGLLLGLVGILPAHAEAPSRDPLVDRVRDAIQHGIKYLKDQEGGHGDLERSVEGRLVVPGGVTALGTVALLNAGVPPEDPVIQRCLRYLRTYKPGPNSQTYFVSLQTMVFSLARQNEDQERIQENVDWLIKAARMRDGQMFGWSYGMAIDPQSSLMDNSNTQYALLGLHEGQLAGAKIDPKVWRSIRDFYMRTQTNIGGWYYSPSNTQTIPTMTAAGFSGLLIAGMDLQSGRETIDEDGRVEHCGEYTDEEALVKALNLLGKQMPHTKAGIGGMEHSYYWLYGIERAGRLSGQRFIGEVDWYRLGCEFLVERQQPVDGSFVGEGHPLIATSFALLFLSRGRTPVLISKMVHGPGEDWNNDRNDARNLVAYTSTEIFNKKPLAWQVFDGRRAGDLTPQRIEQLTADLLQSPIVYFNGHKAPRFEGGEEELLRKYVENGGFIFAEACCGRQEFDTGFRDLMGRLFPGTPLKRLQPGHPIWTASGKFASDPARHELWGIDLGCKTVVVYSPEDLSCWWESNRFDRGKGQEAFQLGVNVIAYATGLEPPKPRLTEVELVRSDEEKKVPRGYLKVGQINFGGDWRPAPQAMPNLMAEMRKLGLDVALQTEEVHVGDRDFTRFKFLYMHGRTPVSMSKDDIKRLRFNLETGGLLLADACCGAKVFDESFRQLMKEVWPDKPLEPIPLNDELFSEELNGSAIKDVRCRREAGGGAIELRTVPPQLEGIRINGRWVVIYSKYDIGCALEKHPSPHCLGHDYESAVRLAGAAVLYAMRR